MSVDRELDPARGRLDDLRPGGALLVGAPGRRVERLPVPSRAFQLPVVRHSADPGRFRRDLTVDFSYGGFMPEGVVGESLPETVADFSASILASRRGRRCRASSATSSAG